MTDLPAGRITFLITDIEGSTRLLETLGENYDEVLDEHRRILREAFSANEGHEFGLEGDGSLVAFPSPDLAVRAALDAQLALAGHDWPSGAEPKVRMGIHTGEARIASDGYRGLAIHQTKRISSAAHGGQVIVSTAAREAIGSDLPPDASLRSLGMHRVRDFPDAQLLFQLDHPALRADFPALRSSGRPGSQLPTPRTTFVGREQELSEARKLLDSSRLVTLTGPGGAGKTRLSLELAAGAEDEFDGGVWFVELGRIDDAARVPNALASTLGIPDDSDEPPLDAVAGAIGDAPTLVVLDNCEHVAEASARTADTLLGSCPGLRILATSREPLGIAGEARLPMPPLAVPGTGDPELVEALYDYDSVRLFCDRASLGQPDFTLTTSNASAVAAIVRRLDGIPLAIELAAARIPTLSPDDIAGRLDDRFRLLSASLRDVPERQRTLRGAIDWSYDLLSEPQRVLLARLSVFHGSFSLEAAEAVGAGGDIASRDVLDLIDALVARSLVQPVPGPHTRYRLLESIHEYATEKLAESGEETVTYARHLHWFDKLVAGTETDGFDLLELDHDNIRTALRWALGQNRYEDALRLAAGMSSFWEIRGHIGEGREWLRTALEGAEPSPARARALLRAATLARIQGDFEATRSLSQEALTLLRGSGDERDVASSLSVLGSVSGGEAGASLSGDSLSLARQLRELSGLTESVQRLGSLAWEEGDHASARTLHEESLAIARRMGDTASEANSLMWLGNVAYAADEPDEAEARYTEALALLRKLGDTRREADVLSNLGLVAQARDDRDKARTLHAQSLEIRRSIGHRRGIAISSLNLAELARAAGDDRGARDYLAESLALADELGDERIAAAARGQMESLGSEPTAARAAVTETAPVTSGAFRREGEFWTIEFDGRTARLKDSKGLRHLCVLLSSPQREVHVLDLVRAIDGASTVSRELGAMTESHVDRLVVESDPFGDAGEILDDQAKAAYKARLDELRDDLGEAESWGDTERASRCRAEIDALTEQLAAAVGLGGRNRKASSAAERARWSVSRAVKTALSRIADAHPALGEHLEATITTGTFCRYAPDPRAPISWRT